MKLKNTLVKKAVIPAAGLGTRFLPATKTIPKEMLTIVDAPIIFYVVEEAVKAGIEDIILIQGRGKTAIEDFFDVSYELEDKLAKDGKIHLLQRLIRIREMANIVSVRQKQPLGLGHAVQCASRIIGKDPFAVLLGDEIMVQQQGEGPNTLGLLTQHYNELQSSIVAIMPVDPTEVSKYGIAEVDATEDGLYKVKSFIEKPQPHQTSSRWALPGRYVFSASIFQELENIQPGRGGEIQLTDAMNQLTQKEKIFGATFSDERFDAGDKLGYLKANVELALKDQELRAEFRKYIVQTAQRVQSEDAPLHIPNKGQFK